jgi:hypothetical protein
MAGRSRSITINGNLFLIPDDVAPQTFKGGEIITGHDEYPGKTVPQIHYRNGSITGLVIDFSGNNELKFNNLKNQTGLSVVYKDSEKIYSCTGYIEASDPIGKDTGTDRSTEFSIISQSGELVIK